MKTYQDLLEIRENEETRMEFVREVINQHKTTDLYKTALVADDYYRRRNRTIFEYQKWLTKYTGELVPDVYTANYKLASNFYGRFTTQLVQYLLGNGISFEKEDTIDRLGDDFEHKIVKATKLALTGAVCFGYWNLDHIEIFPVTEFAPLVDEDTGKIRAGVRFWQLASNKPLRAVFYEEDGFTEYRWEDGKGMVVNEKRAYILNTKYTEAGGDEIVEGENYEKLPIIPLWCDDTHQSTLVGLRENIDAYDLIKSGFCNTIDEASIVYWTINNAGGMDEVDLAEFMHRIKELHGAFVDDNATAEPHSINPPIEGREKLLDRLRADLYEDAMALDVKNIANGAVTATQIQASYEPINSKADDLEYQLTEFIEKILNIAGIEDTPTYTRSKIVNTQEEIDMIIASAQYLNDEYVAKKILELLGDADKADEVLTGLVSDRLVEYDGERTAETAGEAITE